MSERWSWKDGAADNAQLDLRYEPGNWGDVLKSSWAVLVTGALVQELGATRFSYLDPFAGAPDYPLVAAARQRIEQLPDSVFARAQAPFVANDRLASTAGLVVSTASLAGAHMTANVFDAHDGRRAAWVERGDATVLQVADGAEALRDPGQQHLILVDPYDLFDTWGGLMGALLDAAPQATVLLYLFNKAPRGAGRLEQYRSFRRRLGAHLGRGRRLLIGRLPQDAILPRAYHEVLLVAPTVVADTLAARLAQVTHELARPLSDAGSFEQPTC